MIKTELKDLKESNEFLNLLLDNINSAILVADENLQIHHFNNSFLNMFDHAAEGFFGQAFGNATGCVHAVSENKPCGETSHCAHCVLRKSLIQTLIENAPVDRRRLERTFYLNGKPVQKYLEFSTRRISFQGRNMFLVIIYDISDIEQQKIEFQNKQKLIEQDLRAAAAIQQSLLPEGAPQTAVFLSGTMKSFCTETTKYCFTQMAFLNAAIWPAMFSVKTGFMRSSKKTANYLYANWSMRCLQRLKNFVRAPNPTMTSAYWVLNTPVEEKRITASDGQPI